MPAIILVVAFVIFLVVKWNQRQYLIELSSRMNQMITDLCAGEPLDSIQWSDELVQDSVMNSLGPLCDAAAESRSVVSLMDFQAEDAKAEVRIAVDNENIMTLTVEESPDGVLLVLGWSSE